MNDTKDKISETQERNLEKENNEQRFSFFDRDIDEDLENLDIRERYQAP